MRKFTTHIALSSASLLAIATPAWAQDTAAASPQAADAATSDIIVTAQRKAEKVTEVPISITVANQAQLERQQVNTVNDLSRIAPSLEINSAPGQNTGGGGAIRGIGTQTFSPGAVASVGIVVDQVSQGNANLSDLFDVSRIEVLKGPQGTLFGLTTSAGASSISPPTHRTRRNFLAGCARNCPTPGPPVRNSAIRSCRLSSTFRQVPAAPCACRVSPIFARA